MCFAVMQVCGEYKESEILKHGFFAAHFALGARSYLKSDVPDKFQGVYKLPYTFTIDMVLIIYDANSLWIKHYVLIPSHTSTFYKVVTYWDALIIMQNNLKISPQRLHYSYFVSTFWNFVLDFEIGSAVKAFV